MSKIYVSKQRSGDFFCAIGGQEFYAKKGDIKKLLELMDLSDKKEDAFDRVYNFIFKIMENKDTYELVCSGDLTEKVIKPIPREDFTICFPGLAPGGQNLIIDKDSNIGIVGDKFTVGGLEFFARHKKDFKLHL